MKKVSKHQEIHTVAKNQSLAVQQQVLESAQEHNQTCNQTSMHLGVCQSTLNKICIGHCK